MAFRYGRVRVLSQFQIGTGPMGNAVGDANRHTAPRISGLTFPADSKIQDRFSLAVLRSADLVFLSREPFWPRACN